MFLAPLLNQVAIVVWVYFWSSVLFRFSVCLCLCQYHGIFVRMALEDILKCDASSITVFVQGYFGFSETLGLSYELLSSFVKNAIRLRMLITLTL